MIKLKQKKVVKVSDFWAHRINIEIPKHTFNKKVVKITWEDFVKNIITKSKREFAVSLFVLIKFVAILIDKDYNKIDLKRTLI